MKIIIADDDANLLAMVKAHLEHKGHRVVTASDGTELLARLKESRADLVIVDINMPGVSGTEAFERLRASADYRTVPAIIWSGLEIKEGEAAAARGQKVRFLKKPFGLGRLEDIIREVTTTNFTEY